MYLIHVMIILGEKLSDEEVERMIKEVHSKHTMNFFITILIL